MKDLIGIPWRAVFALQADGWYLRCDNIWAKPNPMPDSTKDRPTRSHEYVFLLTRSKRYYYDADAIREPYAASTLREMRDGYSGRATKDFDGAGAQNASSVKGRIIQGLRDKQAGHGRRAAGFNSRWESGGAVNHGGANRRSVWWISPKPYRGAHFATFPPELVELCIKAGSAAGHIVLDPFAGSGTTGMVAVQLGRYPVLIDLNPDYEPMMVERIAKVAL
jgi:DNA modification methylase